MVHHLKCRILPAPEFYAVGGMAVLEFVAEPVTLAGHAVDAVMLKKSLRIRHRRHLGRLEATDGETVRDLLLRAFPLK